MDDSAERRRHQRLSVEGRMTGRATVLAEFRVVALSETGASLEMALPLAEGSQCDLSLSLSHLAVDLKGRVINVRPAEERQGTFIVGVDFEDVPEMDRALLESYLERERRRPA
jgi:hypothetical protein